MTKPENFKKTAVGLIPSDWGAATVGEVARITTGSRNTQDKVEDGQFPFFVRSQTVERINSFSFDGEAVLTAGDGVGTGKVFHYINGQFDCHQRVYRISDFTDRMNGFFFYKYFSASFYDRIMSMTAKSSVDSVRREMIADMAVPVPPIEEQKAIATALKDIDDLIASLDALIAKKRDIKQAAMQQLLTGKTRLPGFEQPWVNMRISSFAPLQRGFDLPTSQLKDGPFPVAYSNGILAHHEKYMVKGPGVITGRSGTIGNITYCERDFWPHNTSLWVTSFEKSDPKFVFYFLQQMNLARFSTGSGVPTLNRNDVHAQFVEIPDLKTEQQAIANALAEIDCEIDAFIEKTQKARRLREGMMQQLLTGRIRLV